MALALPSFTSLFAGAGRSFRRFPLPVACALAFSLLAVGENHDLLNALGDDNLKRLLIILPLGLFAALAAALFAEARFWPSWCGQLLGGLLVAGLLALAFFGPPAPIWRIWDWHWTNFAGPALVLTAMVAPALGGAWDNARFWDFNRAAWLSAAFAWLAALILALGLQATAYALEALLEIDLGYRIPQDFWTLSFGLLWPWLALAGLPRRDSVGEEGPPKWLRFLVHWLLVPLAITYLAVIYAYIVKILIRWQLPEGEVGWVVSSYAAVGVAVHLISAPWRADGAGQVRFFQRGFYPALFAPTVVLALAAWIRIQDYGVTEPRYLLVLLTAWLFLLAVVYSLGLRRLLLVPLSLALLLFAAAFGPWSAGEVSARSQLTRLEATLTTARLLKDGRLSAAEGPVDFDTSKAISSGVEFFTSRERQDLIAGWFEGLAPKDDASAKDLLAALGVRYLQSWESEPYFNYHISPPEDLDVSGFQHLYQLRLWRTSGTPLTIGDGRFQLTYDKAPNVLAVTDDDGHRIAIDLAALVRELMQASVASQVPEGQRALLSRAASDGPLRVRLLITSLNGREGTDGIEVNSGDAQVLIGSGPAPSE